MNTGQWFSSAFADSSAFSVGASVALWTREKEKDEEEALTHVRVGRAGGRGAVGAKLPGASIACVSCRSGWAMVRFSLRRAPSSNDALRISISSTVRGRRQSSWTIRADVLAVLGNLVDVFGIRRRQINEDGRHSGELCNFTAGMVCPLFIDEFAGSL